MRLHIVIDTREQRPFHFPCEYADVSRGTLAAGDYALAGDAHFAVERKSLDDFASTMSSNWSRFCRELDRMQEFSYCARVMVVAASMEDLREVLPNHPNLSPAFYVKRLAQLTLMGVTVLLAGNEEMGAVLTFTLLLHRSRDLTPLEGHAA